MTENNAKKTAVALGNFDGLHMGHISVINTAVAQKSNGLAPVVLLFDIHPRHLLCGKAPKMLMTPDLQKEMIISLGADVHTLDFGKIRDMSPEEFVKEIIVKKFNAAFVSCGYNFRFGKNGAGDTKVLSALCEKYSVNLSVNENVLSDGESISSTKIRALIENGEIEKANRMLQRAFSYNFEVVTGDKIGKKLLGFPTINQIFPEGHIVPKSGVYASETIIDGIAYASMTNIGKRPTVNGETLRSETCIHGIDRDLYGTHPLVMLTEYIREEKKFPSLEALSRQLEKDSLRATEIFNKRHGVKI